MPSEDKRRSTKGELSIRLRPLEVRDLDRLAELERRNMPVPWSKDQIESEFRKTVSILLGVELNAKLVGYVLAYLVVDELHILTIAIDKPHRQKGLGEMLLKHLLECAVDLGAKQGWLEVRKGNIPAREFYAKFGFRQSFTRYNYYSDNGEDALVLTKSLA